MTSFFEDEKLAAYADGELPAAEAGRITAKLATDADLRRRVARFQASRQALSDLFGDVPTSEPASDLTALLTHPGATHTRAATPPRRAWQPSWPAAAAAALVLLAGGYGLGRLHSALGTPSPIDIQLSVDATRMAALENLGNHETFEATLPIGGSTMVQPLATYIDQEGRFCRSYRLTVTADGQTLAHLGEACRSADGWAVLAERPEPTAGDTI